jgi:hypothetical protein
MRRVGNLAVEHDWVIWNQGGSGDDVERANPGNVVRFLVRPAVRPFRSSGCSRPKTRRTSWFSRRVRERSVGRSLKALRPRLRRLACV